MDEQSIYRVRIERSLGRDVAEAVECADDAEGFGIAVGKCVAHHLIDDDSADIPCPLNVLKQLTKMMIEGQRFRSGELDVLHAVLNVTLEEERGSNHGDPMVGLVIGLGNGLRLARSRLDERQRKYLADAQAQQGDTHDHA